MSLYVSCDSPLGHDLYIPLGRACRVAVRGSWGQGDLAGVLEYAHDLAQETLLKAYETGQVSSRPTALTPTSGESC
jgi:DNA-directed RNA polymerase specialized sigma24 family protein